MRILSIAILISFFLISCYKNCPEKGTCNCKIEIFHDSVLVNTASITYTDAVKQGCSSCWSAETYPHCYSDCRPLNKYELDTVTKPGIKIETITTCLWNGNK